jgi:hypothetical protein
MFKRVLGSHHVKYERYFKSSKWIFTLFSYIQSFWISLQRFLIFHSAKLSLQIIGEPPYPYSQFVIMYLGEWVSCVLVPKFMSKWVSKVISWITFKQVAVLKHSKLCLLQKSMFAAKALFLPKILKVLYNPWTILRLCVLLVFSWLLKPSRILKLFYSILISYQTLVHCKKSISLLKTCFLTKT